MRSKKYNVHDNPNVCRKSSYLLTNEDEIEVQGPQTSGEVEYVAIIDKGEVLISVGSDHNDRTLETMWTDALGYVYDTAKSKQMVPSIVARDTWKYEDVKDHWDQLNLKSFITVGGRIIPYQDFTLVDLVDLEYHFKTSPFLREDGVVLLSGSSAVLPSIPSHIYQFQSTIKGMTFPSEMRLEFDDPVLGRTISHSYKVSSIEPPGSLSL